MQGFTLLRLYTIIIIFITLGTTKMVYAQGQISLEVTNITADGICTDLTQLREYLTQVSVNNESIVTYGRNFRGSGLDGKYVYFAECPQ